MNCEVEKPFDRLEAALDEVKALSNGRKVASDEDDLFFGGGADIANVREVLSDEA